MEKRLYRSRRSSMLGGVCGGLGEYFNLDPIIVRIIFVLLLFAGPGFLIYLLMWIFVPREGQAEATPSENIRTGAEEVAEKARNLAQEIRNDSGHRNVAGLLIGIVLIGIGVIILLRNLAFPWLWWLRLGTLWPLILVVVGALLLWPRLKGDK